MATEKAPLANESKRARYTAYAACFAPSLPISLSFRSRLFARLARPRKNSSAQRRRASSSLLTHSRTSHLIAPHHTLPEQHIHGNILMNSTLQQSNAVAGSSKPHSAASGRGPPPAAAKEKLHRKPSCMACRQVKVRPASALEHASVCSHGRPSGPLFVASRRVRGGSPVHSLHPPGLVQLVICRILH